MSEIADQQHAMIQSKSSFAAQRPFRRNEHPGAQWFGEGSIGLFVHWGLSSVSAKVDLSWGMIADTPWDTDPARKMTPEAYFALAEKFRPRAYDPDAWLKAAKEAGFRYAVLTTKHHDGFALWPTRYGDFHTGRYTDSADFVRPYVEACRKNGLKVGLYYSPPDWYFQRHEMSFRFQSKGTPESPHYGLRHEPIEIAPPSAERIDAYKKHIRGQIEELLTNYGTIDLLWFDGGPEALSIDDIRAMQPSIVVNSRMHGYGDYETPERTMPTSAPDGWWELCDIWPEGSGWGYTEPHRYQPTEWVLSRWAQVKALGGNYLINVAPNADGELPPEYYERMRELGAALRG
ncbi:MAG TPA: alpha-L-fucosidase [Paenibacillus sp.]|nr:alpha-L-fucosidase [Paenibacillus sp.]